MSLLSLCEKKEKEYRKVGDTEKADRIARDIEYLKEALGEDVNKF